jgi:hypothetical protein
MFRVFADKRFREGVLADYLLTKGFELTKFYDGKYQILRIVGVNKYRVFSPPFRNLREVEEFVKKNRI